MKKSAGFRRADKRSVIRRSKFSNPLPVLRLRRVITTGGWRFAYPPLYDVFTVVAVSNDGTGLGCVSGPPQGARSATGGGPLTRRTSQATVPGRPTGHRPRRDAVSTLDLQGRSVDFALIALPQIDIEQYLWPGSPAARISKVGGMRRNAVLADCFLFFRRFQ